MAEALLVQRALRRAEGMSGGMLLWCWQFHCREVCFASKDLVMVELSSSKAPSPNLFPHSPNVTWLVKTGVNMVSANEAVTRTNFVSFIQYPSIPYSKSSSLPLGHLPISSLEADSIPTNLPSLSVI